MDKHIITKEQAEQIVKEVFTVADFCRKVGWQPRGENYRVFYKYVKDYNLDISHFTGKKPNLDNKNNIGISDEEYFKDNKLIKGSALMQRLINKVGREYKCECCGISEWNGKPITLQIHHKDGDHLNNTLSNLQILCPNCHSQTDNFCWKNRGQTKQIYYCLKCGKQLLIKTKTGLCKDCYKLVRKEKSLKPSKEVLLDDCKMLKSYSKISKKYNVSDKTIRKWCDSYGINLKQLNIKPEIKPSKNSLNALVNKYSKAIYQFDLNEHFIKEFSSKCEASRQTGIAASNIKDALHGKRKTAGGFIWKYKYGSQS